MELPSADTVHLFRARLDEPPVAVEVLRSFLSSEERVRAERFVFEHDRRRYEIATGLLRRSLGAITGSDPAGLVFERGKWGKPALPGGPSFNISHSGEWWLMGVARDGRVGVDVEVHRPLRDLEELTARWFHSAEAAAVLEAEGEERRHAFFRVWTRKEAFVKAVGRGLGFALDSFVVAADAAPPRVLLDLPATGEPLEHWEMASVGWDIDLAAAVAWDRPGGRVEWRPFASDRA